MKLSGKTKLAGVLGWPVGHSLWPRIFNAWLERYDIDGAFVPLPVEPAKFTPAVKALPSLGFVGATMTTPYKESAMVVADELDETARRMGMANMLTITPGGMITAGNTDGSGFLAAVRQAAPVWRPDAGAVVVLGAGGAAQAAIRVLIDSGVSDVRLFHLNRARAESLAKDFGEVVEVGNWDDIAGALAGATLLLNGTALGMEGNPPLDLALDGLQKTAVIADIVHTPAETALLKAARQRGNKAVDGLAILLHQARPAFTAWFGVEPAIDDETRRAVLA